LRTDAAQRSKEHDYDALNRLVEQLDQRRTRIPELLLQAKRSNRQPFPKLEMTRGERHEDSSEL